MFDRKSLKSGLTLLSCAAFVFMALLGGCGSTDAKKTNSDGDLQTCFADKDCPEGYTCKTLTNECVQASDGDKETAEELESADQTEKDEEPAAEEIEEVSDEGEINEIESDEEVKPDDTDGKKIEVFPNSVDFGSVFYGGRSIREVTIRNASTAANALQVNEISFLHDPTLIDFTFRTQDGRAVRRTLQPGEGFVVEVAYEPNDAEKDEGEMLLIASDDSDNPLVRVPLVPKYKGEATIAVDKTSIEFGDVPVSGSSMETVKITNDCGDGCNQALRIDSIVLASSGGLVGNDFVIQPSAAPTPTAPVFLNPGQVLTLNITFSPTYEGQRNETIYIISNDKKFPAPGLSLSMKAKAVVSDMSVVPSPVEFGNVRVGEFKRVQVQITNSGNDQLNISSITLRQAVGDFALDLGGVTSWSLAPEESTLIIAIFTPTVVGEQFNRMIIVSDGDAPNFQVPLHGSAATSKIKYTPEEINFGSVQVSSVGRQFLNIVSEGTAALNITKIEILDSSGAFGFVDSPDYYIPVNPGFSKQIEFTFAPPGVGAAWQAKAKIYSDAENTDSDKSIAVILKASSSDPRIFITPDAKVDFNRIDIGTSDKQDVIVKNIGSGDLTIFDVKLSGGTSPYFSLEGAPTAFPLNLAMNESFTFKAVYSPLTSGPVTGELLIVHNDYDLFRPGDLDRSSYSVLLNAEGTTNHKPVAALVVNNYIRDPITVAINTMLTLKDTGSKDPDAGDTIAEWNYQIEAAPAGHNELSCNQNVCTVLANVSGEWLFSLIVKDNRGLESDKASFKVKVNTPPTAVLRANGAANDIFALLNTQVLLDDQGSGDVDGALVEWDFSIASAPPGYNALQGSGSSRTVNVNILGDWTICLRVKDNDAAWSQASCRKVTVAPGDNMKIIVDQIRWSCFHLTVTPPPSVSSDPCDEGDMPTCSWGPSHSGPPKGGGGTNDLMSIEFIWEKDNKDGDYLIRLLRQGTFLGGLSCDLDFEDAIFHFYRNNIEIYQCKRDWSLAGTNTWDFTWKRENGHWGYPIQAGGNSGCTQLAR